MKVIDVMLAEVYRSDTAVGRLLLRTADRRRTDHEVHFVCRDLARWTDEHRRDLADIGARRHIRLREEPIRIPAPIQHLRRAVGTALGRRHSPSLLLLRDLRSIHRSAAVASVNWEILAQAAQAAEDTELLDLATRCHPETLRQLRWANAKIKELAPQAVATP